MLLFTPLLPAAGMGISEYSEQGRGMGEGIGAGRYFCVALPLSTEVVMTAVTKQQSAHVNPKLLVALLTLGVFGIINTEMGVVGIIPQIAETFNVSVPDAGWTVSVFALMVAISAPIMPLLCSGFNRKLVMVVALGVFTLSNIVSTITNSFAVLLVARAIPAILHPVYVSLAFTVAAKSVAPENSAKAISMVFVGVSAGMVLGVPVSSFIVTHSAVAYAMAGFGIVNALVMLLTVFLLPSMPVQERMTYGEQLRVLKRPVVWFSVLAFTLVNGAMFGFFSFMSDFLHEVSNWSFDVVAAILLGYSLTNIVGNVLVGRYFMQHKRFFIASMSVVLMALYVALYLFGESSYTAVALIMVIGLAAGGSSIVGQYMISSSAPEAPDFANGLFLTAANAGTMVGTALCGLFITYMGTAASLFGTLLFLAGSLFFIAARLSSTRSGRTINDDSVSPQVQMA